MRVHNRRSASISILIIILMFSANSLFHPAQSDSTPPFSCDPSNPSTNSLPFCNTSLHIAARVNDVVTRLTLDEKIQQLVNSAAAVPRLNISAYEWWSEALHGISRHGKGISFNGSIKAATMFPQIILSAASFDPRLWYRISQAIGREGRAVFNAGQGKGMTFWAPNINIFRDPRWGRGQETPGEDPLVAAKYAVAYVRGLQGDSFEGGKIKTDGRDLMASACCKHYTAHDLDNWNGVTRYSFDAKVDFNKKTTPLKDGSTLHVDCILCDELLHSLVEMKHGRSFFRNRGGRGRGRGRRGRGNRKQQDPKMSFRDF